MNEERSPTTTLSRSLQQDAGGGRRRRRTRVCMCVYIKKVKGEGRGILVKGQTHPLSGAGIDAQGGGGQEADTAHQSGRRGQHRHPHLL